MTTTTRPGLLPDPVVHKFTENEWSTLAFDLPQDLAHATASWGSDTVVLPGGLLEIELEVDVNHAAGVADALYRVAWAVRLGQAVSERLNSDYPYWTPTTELVPPEQGPVVLGVARGSWKIQMGLLRRALTRALGEEPDGVAEALQERAVEQAAEQARLTAEAAKLSVEAAKMSLEAAKVQKLTAIIGAVAVAAGGVGAGAKLVLEWQGQEHEVTCPPVPSVSEVFRGPSEPMVITFVMASPDGSPMRVTASGGGQPDVA